MIRGGSTQEASWRALAGLVVVFLVAVVIVIATFAVGTVDPYGIRGAPALNGSSVNAWRPIYGAVLTPGWTLDWSPDGRWLALGDNQLTPGVEILDAATGRPLHTMTAPGWVYSVRWSPDGNHLAVGAEAPSLGSGPGSVYIYAQDGSVEQVWPAINLQMILNGVGGVDWSPDGTRVVGVQGGRFLVWDLATAATVIQNGNASVYGNSVDWSPDGRLLLFGYPGGATVFDATTGALREQLTDGNSDTRAAAWSHSGELIGTAALDGCAAVFRVDGTLLWSRCDHPEVGDLWAAPPSWSPDDALLAVANAEGVFILDAANGTLLRTLQFPVQSYGPALGSWVRGDGPYLDFAAAFSPSGNLLASVASTTHPSLRLWGIPRSPVTPLIGALGVAVAIGVPLSLGREFVAVVSRPGMLRAEWLRTPRVRGLGATLLMFTFAFSLLQASAGDLMGRVTYARIVPPVDWYFLSLVLSTALGVMGAVLGLFAFRRALRPKKQVQPQPSLSQSATLLGWLLVPVVWTVAIAVACTAALRLLELGSSADGPLSMVVAVITGTGLVLASRLVPTLTGRSVLRGVGGLVASTLVYIGAIVGIVLAAVGMMNLLQVRPTPEMVAYGITVTFSFGLTPFLLAVLGSAVLVVEGTLFAYPPKALLFLYTRLRPSQVLDLDSRRQILEYVRDHPGVHFRELLRSIRMGSGSLHYHLYVLEREGYLIPRRDGMYRRFFALWKAEVQGR